MLKRRCLCLAVIAVLLVFASVASGALLFSDDFERDAVGKEPNNFEMYDHPQNSGSFKMEIEEDPEGESGNVLHTFGYALWIPKAASRDDWSDFIWEWDWMWANTGEYPGTAFRITDTDYYHFSPREDNVNIGFWYYDGGWNQIGALVQYDFQTNIWNRYQVTSNGNTFAIKIKRRDNPTPFADIAPLIEATDDNLQQGPLSACGTNTDAWVDNLIVGETEGDLKFPVEPMGRLARTWGAIKKQY